MQRVGERTNVVVDRTSPRDPRLYETRAPRALPGVVGTAHPSPADPGHGGHLSGGSEVSGLVRPGNPRPASRGRSEAMDIGSTAPGHVFPVLERSEPGH